MASADNAVTARIMTEQQTRIERQQDELDRLERLGHDEAAEHARITLNHMTAQMQNLKANLKQAEERAALELDDVSDPYALCAGAASGNGTQRSLPGRARHARR